MYLRPSCYECKYAKLPRISDVSLADFWKYNGVLKEKNENKGISAVILSTEKGYNLFNAIKDKIEYHEVEEEFLTKRSRHVYIHPEENGRRSQFFKDLDDMTFNSLSKKYNIKLGLKRRVLNMIPSEIRVLIGKMIGR